MLVSVGLNPETLVEVDSASDGWRERVAHCDSVITDLITAGGLAL